MGVLAVIPCEGYRRLFPCVVLLKLMEANAMPDQAEQLWVQLCEQASREEDPANLLKLVNQLERVLEAQQKGVLLIGAKNR